MRFQIYTIFIPFLLLFLGSCHVSKNIPNGSLLLKKNKIEIKSSNTTVNTTEINELVRQQANSRLLGIPFKLILFNSLDSLKIANKRNKINLKITEKNKKDSLKVSLINAKRIEKARENGKKLYTQKVIIPIDIENSRLFFREWLKYKIAEKPVIFDSVLMKKSINQIGFYLKRKGYYYSSLTANSSNIKNKKVSVDYSINTGPLYTIDSVYYPGVASSILNIYKKYFLIEYLSKNNGIEPLLNKPFDIDYLEDYREVIAVYMRNQTFYGFSASSIIFTADTSKSSMKVILGIEFQKRLVADPNNKDSLIQKNYVKTFINKVHFHLSDTSMLNVRFASYLDKEFKRSIVDSLDNNFLATKNEFFYAKEFYTKKKRKELKITNKDALNPNRMIYVHYNGEKPCVNVNLLELQNYLEMENVYKEVYLERSYQSLNQLGLFSIIKPIIKELPNNKLDVHYFLIPAKRKVFAFEPKFTSSFGLLGVNASINYSDRNIFGGGQKLTFSFGGGFESQPIVFDDGSRKGIVFNTFEFGPSLKLEIPGLFPTKVNLLSKRQKPKTVISMAFNYEKRDIFERSLFQLNYTFKMLVDKTQIFEFGLPFASVIKYVSINKSPIFESQINSQNDLFLKNSYSNQFIWEDFKLSFIYDNTKKQFLNTKNKLFKKAFLDAQINFTSSFSSAGSFLSWFNRYQDTLSNGQFSFYGIGYAQFVRNDNIYIFNKKFNKNSSLNLKFFGGFGIPFGNSKLSMPYDYSFFGGGANDNRGWRARTLGPGSFKYYLDSTATTAQIGDIRLGGTIEYRYSINSSLKGAFFTDFGNIWTYKEDDSRVGAKFSNNWYEQFAVALGVGFRLDLDFFIIRLDFGVPVYNPALPSKSRWISQSREPYYQEGIAYYSLPNFTPEMNRDRALSKLPKPFAPALQFGIGYPF